MLIRHMQDLCAGVSYSAEVTAVSGRQHSHAGNSLEDMLPHGDAMAAGPSSSGHEGKVWV